MFVRRVTGSDDCDESSPSPRTHMSRCSGLVLDWSIICDDLALSTWAEAFDEALRNVSTISLEVRRATYISLPYVQTFDHRRNNLASIIMSSVVVLITPLTPQHPCNYK